MPFFVLCLGPYNNVELRQRRRCSGRAVNRRMSSSLGPAHRRIPIHLTDSSGKTALTGKDGSTPIPAYKFARICYTNCSNGLGRGKYVHQRNSSEQRYADLHAIDVQIKMGILKREWSFGDGLPSVRSLASELGINMHTVNKAYNLLADEGVLVKNQKGYFVSERAMIASNEATESGDAG